MTYTKKPFPKRTLAIAVVSLPFWYAFFVFQGRLSKIVAWSCAFALAVVLVILYVVWRRAR